jgi:hypothetical protein
MFVSSAKIYYVKNVYKKLLITFTTKFILFFSRSFSFLRARFGFIEHVTGALGDVPFGSGFVELPSTMGTLDIIRITRGRRRGQIRQFSALGHVCLRLFGGTDGVDELFVGPAPVFLGHLFARLKCATVRTSEVQMLRLTLLLRFFPRLTYCSSSVPSTLCLVAS